MERFGNLKRNPNSSVGHLKEKKTKPCAFSHFWHQPNRLPPSSFLSNRLAPIPLLSHDSQNTRDLHFLVMVVSAYQLSPATLSGRTHRQPVRLLTRARARRDGSSPHQPCAPPCRASLHGVSSSPLLHSNCSQPFLAVFTSSLMVIYAAVSLQKLKRILSRSCLPFSGYIKIYRSCSFLLHCSLACFSICLCYSIVLLASCLICSLSKPHRRLCGRGVASALRCLSYCCRTMPQHLCSPLPRPRLRAQQLSPRSWRSTTEATAGAIFPAPSKSRLARRAPTSATPRPHSVVCALPEPRRSCLARAHRRALAL